MEPGLNHESLVMWTGGCDTWCQVAEVRALRSGKLPESQSAWIGELYYGNAGNANMTAVMKGLGKGFEFHP